MAVNIGPKIGIDGEKQYRQEIQAIIQQGKTLAAQMGSVSTAFANADDKEEAMTKVSKTLNDQIKNQKDLVAKLSDAVSKSTDKTGENSTTTQKWKEQLYKAEKKLNQLEGQTAESAAGVQDFAESEETATKKTSVFGDVLKAKLLSDAIKTGIKFLADQAKKLGGYLKDAAVGAASYGDEINTLATQTGLSTDALQEYRYMAGLLDVELNTITGAHAKLTKNMASAAKGTGATYEAFEKLGVAVTDANGNLRNADDVFNDAISALGEIENETERDAVAMQILGKSAQELNPLIKAGAKTLSDLRKEAHDVGAVLDKETLNQLNEAQDSFDRIGKAAEILKNKIGAKIFAEFNAELAEATSLMQDFVSGKATPEEIERRLSKLFDSIIKKAEKLGADALPYVGKAFEKIIKFAADKYPQLAGKLIDKLPGILDKIGKGAEKILPSLISKLGATIGKLLINGPEIIKAGVNLAVSLGKGILQGIKGIGSQLAYDLLSDTAKEAIENAKQIKEQINGIPGAIDDVKRSVAEADAKREEAQKWIQIFDDLSKKTNLSRDEQEKLKTAVERLNELFPELGLQVDEETGKWNLNTQEIKTNIETLSARARAAAYYDAASEALQNQIKLEQELNAAIDARGPAAANQEKYAASVEKLQPILTELSAAWASATTEGKTTQDVLEGLTSETKKYIEQNGIEIKSVSDLYKAMDAAGKQMREYKQGLADANTEVAAYDDTIKAAKQGISDYQKQIDYFFQKGDDWSSRAARIGAEIANGMIGGMDSRAMAVAAAGGRLVNNAISQMKRIANIHSPSKVTEQLIGKNLALGVVKGFEDVMESQTATRAFDLNTAFDAMSTEPSVTNNNRNTTNNLGGVNINVYAAQNQSEEGIARAVLNAFTNEFNSKKAVFA